MSIHDAFLEVAAAAIDFDLDETERGELDRHLAGCDACRQTAAAFRDDAAAIASGPGPHLAPAQSERILDSVLRPPRSSTRLRLLAVGTLVAVLGAGVVALGLEIIRRSGQPIIAVVPSPGASSTPGPTPGLTGPAGPSPLAPLGTPRPTGVSAAGELPVRASGQELGTLVRMAPGADGRLYVSIPAPDGSVLLALLDMIGRPRPGWPVTLSGATSCELLLPADDGSVRALCTLDSPDGNRFAVKRAFAFDSKGTLLAGWPIDLDLYGADGYFAGRVVGDDLIMFAWKSLGDQIEAGQPAGNAWIMTVAPDGTVRSGVQIAYGTGCCDETWAVGPDAVAYGAIHDFVDGPAGVTSDLAALGPAGVPAGFPVAIEGLASEPAFDAAGRIHVIVGTPFERPARTLVFDSGGQAVDAGSGELDIAAPSEFDGIEGTGGSPAAPLVSADGTSFLIDISGGRTTAAGVSPSGQLMAGWPYRSDAGHQTIGTCPQNDVCEGSFWALPTIGPENVLYLLHAATSTTAGGSVVAIGQDGRVVAGWPVGLRRSGSEFWSIVVAPDGTVYALAIEPEPNGRHSATILSLAPDSTVLYTSTIVEP